MRKLISILLIFVLWCMPALPQVIGGKAVVGGKTVFGAASASSSITLAQSPVVNTNDTSITITAVTTGQVVMAWIMVPTGQSITTNTLSGSGTTLTLTALSGSPCATGSNDLYAFYGVVGAANAGNTSVDIRRTPTSGTMQYYAQVWNGLSSSPFDKQGCSTGNSSSPVGGTVTPASSGSLVIGEVRLDAATTFASTGGFTDVPNQNAGISFATQYQTGVSSATHAQWSSTGSGTWAAITAIFK